MGLLTGLGMLGGGLANALGLGVEGYSKDVETRAKRERERLADIQNAKALGQAAESHTANMEKLKREAALATATDEANRMAYDRLPTSHPAKALPYDRVQPYTQLGLDFSKTQDTERGMFGALEAYRGQPTIDRVLKAGFNLQQAGSYKPYLETAQKAAENAAELERLREGARLKPPPRADGMTLSGISTLRGQFNQEKSYQDAVTTAAGVEKMRAAAQDPSPAGDMALIYGWNNVLDPTSIVKEGEFAMAAKSGSLPQQVTAQVTRLLKGERLTPEQRADFVNRAESLAKARQRQFTRTADRYTGIASRQGVNPADVVTDPFVGLFDPKPADLAPPADRARSGGGGRGGGPAGGSSGNINLGAGGRTKDTVADTVAVAKAGAWQAANPQLPGESDKAYFARFDAAQKQRQRR